MNLLSKLHKNSILTGPVECYCLACGCLLRGEEESYTHIHEPDHVDKLDTVQRPENYKDDCIIKIKEGYFCAFCNIVLPTIKRVSLHITEPMHRDNKNSQSITRHVGVIFAFDMLIIDDRSWNGVDGSTCFVCNEDYDDEDSHKSEANHVLNLIQIKCEFGETYIYRMVDEDSFFCLICNDILLVSEKPTHHKSEKHLKLYLKSKNEGIAIRNQKPAASNNAASVIEPNNITLILNTNEVTPIQLPKDSKDKCNSKPEIHESQNRGPDVIDDSSLPKNTQNSTRLNTDSVDETAKLNTQDKPKLNTEKIPVLRLNTPNNNTQKTAKLHNAKDSEEIKLDSQNKNTSTSNLNIERVQTSQQLKDKPKADLSTAKVTIPESSEALTAKVKTDESVPKTTLNTSEVNGTDKSEPCFYEFLKARNFVTNVGYDVMPFCSLCDATVNRADILTHKSDKHHKNLYAKHVARKNAQRSANLKTGNGLDKNKTDNEPSEATEDLKRKESKASTVKCKENAIPVIEPAKNNTQVKSAPSDDKPSEIKGQVVTKDAKCTTPDKNTAPVIEQAFKAQVNVKSSENTTNVDKINKENTAPENKAQNVNTASIGKSSNETNKKEIKPEPAGSIIQPKKATKQTQKKAAKVKTAGVVAPLPKEINETGTQVLEAFELGEVTAEEQRSHTDASKVLTEDSKKGNSAQIADTKKKDQINDQEKDKEKVQVNGETVSSRLATDADLKTEKLLTLLKTVSQVDGALKDVVINNKYVLGNLSFVLVVCTGTKAECVACNEELTLDDIHTHIATEGHGSNFEQCLVVTSLDDEFIRQVKTQEYHCGYCNMLLPSWNDMKSHLESYRHSDAKTSASWRLERYHPYLKHCQSMEVRSVLSTIFRCTRE